MKNAHQRQTEADQRNINPHQAAVAAMYLYGSDYAAQNGGSMDYWDKLSEGRKRLCRDLVADITKAQPELSGDAAMKVSVGECFRDTYYDSKSPMLDGIDQTKRVIRVVEVLPNGVIAEVVRDITGEVPKKPRRTTLQFKTLRAGYEPCVL